MENTTTPDPFNHALRFGFEDGENLLDELNSGDGVSPELSQNMYEEMRIARRDPDGILFVGTEGTKTITVFLAPQSIVGGFGPVLVPTFDSRRVEKVKQVLDQKALKAAYPSEFGEFSVKATSTRVVPKKTSQLVGE